MFSNIVKRVTYYLSFLPAGVELVVGYALEGLYTLLVADVLYEFCPPIPPATVVAKLKQKNVSQI